MHAQSQSILIHAVFIGVNPPPEALLRKYPMHGPNLPNNDYFVTANPKITSTLDPQVSR